MYTINAIAKELLGKDVQAFIKLGWVREDLTPTEKGRDQLTSFLFLKHKDELAKIAQAEVKEQEEKK